MKQLHLRLDDELYEKLNLFSEDKNESVQNCVREAIALYVTDARKKIKQTRI